VGWPNAPLRSLKNSTTRNWEASGSPLAPNRPGEGETRADGTGIPRYHFSSPTREVLGDAGAMALYAGESVGLVSSVAPARTIVEELAGGTS
jgi:nitronate monooxygenase